MASIAVSIAVADTIGDSAASALGSATDVITDDQVQTFGFTQSSLIAWVNGSWGGTPTGVWLHNPCQNNETWFGPNDYPVHVTTRVASARVVSVDVQPVVAATEHLTNDLNKQVILHPTVSTQKTSSISTSHSESNKLKVGQKFSYSIGFASGETNVEYEHDWEDTTTVTQQQSFTIQVSADIPVDPGQTVLAELMLSQGKMVVEVVCEMVAGGQIFALYGDSPYKGSNLWQLDLRELKPAFLNPALTDKQTLTIDFYADAQVRVRDVTTGQVLHVERAGGGGPRPVARARRA